MKRKLMGSLLLTTALAFTALPLSASQIVLHGTQGVFVTEVKDNFKEMHYMPYNCSGACNLGIYVYEGSGSVTVKIPERLKLSSLDEVLTDLIANADDESELSTVESISVTKFLALMSANSELATAFDGMKGNVVINGVYNLVDRYVEVTVNSDSNNYVTKIPLD